MPPIRKTVEEGNDSRTARRERHAALYALPEGLDGWSSFTREISLPGDLAVALSTGRPELVRGLSQGRQYSPEECELIRDALATLIETNEALRQHASRLTEHIRQVSELVGGAQGKLMLAEDFANFRSPGVDEYEV